MITLAYNGLPSWMASKSSPNIPDVGNRGAQWLRYTDAKFSGSWGSDISAHQRPALYLKLLHYIKELHFFYSS